MSLIFVFIFYLGIISANGLSEFTYRNSAQRRKGEHSESFRYRNNYEHKKDQHHERLGRKDEISKEEDILFDKDNDWLTEEDYFDSFDIVWDKKSKKQLLDLTRDEMDNEVADDVLPFRHKPKHHHRKQQPVSPPLVPHRFQDVHRKSNRINEMKFLHQNLPVGPRPGLHNDDKDDDYSLERIKKLMLPYVEPMLMKSGQGILNTWMSENHMGRPMERTFTKSLNSVFATDHVTTHVIAQWVNVIAITGVWLALGAMFRNSGTNGRSFEDEAPWEQLLPNNGQVARALREFANVADRWHDEL